MVMLMKDSIVSCLKLPIIALVENEAEYAQTLYADMIEINKLIKFTVNIVNKCFLCIIFVLISNIQFNIWLIYQD